ncbi:MAG: hypothetical protein SFY80_01555, partial [Verrucomicrobiota bacterium]|nr:hypothetical protein [Verrucomicrobiota bacterium]
MFGNSEDKFAKGVDFMDGNGLDGWKLVQVQEMVYGIGSGDPLRVAMQGSTNKNHANNAVEHNKNNGSTLPIC